MMWIESRWRDALLEAMIPALPGGPLQGLAAADRTPFWNHFRRTAPLLLRFGFRVAVALLTWLAFVQRGRPFHRLSADQQDAWLASASRSRFWSIRQLVNVVKLIACFACFNDPAVHGAVRERAEVAA